MGTVWPMQQIPASGMLCTYTSSGSADIVLHIVSSAWLICMTLMYINCITAQLGCCAALGRLAAFACALQSVYVIMGCLPSALSA